MSPRAIVASSLIGFAIAVSALDGATTTRQQAEAMTRKIAVIKQQGEVTRPPGQTRTSVRRTSVTESEINSWFAYSAEPVLPAGVINPQVTILAGGKVKGAATVDLETFSKRRSRGSVLDPWNLLGGRVPVVVTGTLMTKDGQGRFEMDEAEISGIPVPSALLQELVSYYSRSSDQPHGIRLDEKFELPANIKQIEVGQGQVVVVQ